MLQDDTLPITSLIEDVAGINTSLIDRLPDITQLNQFNAVVEDNCNTYKEEGFPRYCVHTTWKRDISNGTNGGEMLFHYFSNLDTSERICGQYPNFLGSYLRVEKNCTSLNTNPRESLTAFLIFVTNINSAAEELVKSGACNEGIKHLVRANKLSNPYFKKALESGLYTYCDRSGTPTENAFYTQYWDDTLYLGNYPNPSIHHLDRKFKSDKIVKGLVLCHKLAKEEAANLLAKENENA